MSQVMRELEREAKLGGVGEMADREIRQIDFGDFAQRRDEIAEQLWAAATDLGFFQVVNHGIPAADIDAAFAMSAKFFALPAEVKGKYPLRPGTNAGWEYKAQVRPSTRTADQKESYQITLPRMAALWPSEQEVAAFRVTMASFEAQNWALGMKILSCFALRLGLGEGFFSERHDPSSPHYQSTLRLLHYLPLADPKPEDFSLWRAGAHTDFDCLTLLHQRSGQGGLQVCPGKEIESGRWTDVAPVEGVVTCNIGDMLMRWSDDRLQSTLHRVRMPAPDDPPDPRYSIAFFCQANTDVIIEGPEQKYPPISAAEYLQQRIAANRL